VRGVRFHPNGVWLITAAEDRCLRVFEIVSGRLVKCVEDAADGFVTCLALRPGGVAGPPLLLTGGTDAAARLWDVR
jgi:WD40 repeat protein